MAKDVTRNIMAFVVVVVAGYVAFTMFTGGQVGFATADVCHGNPVLELNPSLVQAGDRVIAGVTGLVGCADKEVHIKDGDCNAQTITSYICGDNFCSRKVAFQKHVVGKTQISACVDRNDNDWFFDSGERSTAILTVVTQPDLMISDLAYYPKNPVGLQPIKMTATIKNLGALSVTDAEFTCKVYNGHMRGKYAVYEDTQKVTILMKDEVDVVFKGITLVKGIYTIEITADPNNKFVEFDRSNNLFTTSLTVI